MKKNRQIDHEKYMDEALKEAKKAFDCGEVPIGAVITDKDGNIIGRGNNNVERLGCQTGHAEINAIKDVCEKIVGWRLEDCTLYVTLEPCLMCFGLIGLSRIKMVYYGAKSPLFGSSEEVESVGHIYCKGLVVKGGLKEAQCTAILRLFFEQARKGRDGCETKTRIPRKSKKKFTQKTRGNN
ncbi:nucleoside deaminase [Candidatus Dependentiae bacterium]